MRKPKVQVMEQDLSNNLNRRELNGRQLHGRQLRGHHGGKAEIRVQTSKGETLARTVEE